jgi:hypothetical protein
MARRRREPTVEVRKHSCADGSVTEMWSVRFYDATGTRRRLRCASREEADFERARLILAASLGQTAPVPADPMVLLQAMFTLAIEWGEADTNPVSVVRRPRQGRHRAIEPLTPEDIERLRRVLLDSGDDRSATLVSVIAYAGLRPRGRRSDSNGATSATAHCSSSRRSMRAASSARRRTGSTAPSTCWRRSPRTSRSGAPPPGGRQPRSSSRGRTGSRGGPTTGITGGTATSTRPPRRPASAAPPVRPAPRVRLAAHPRTAHVDR